MSRIFISHSSHDVAAATALVQWLSDQEPQLANEIFLDVDPVGGLRPGARWKRELFRQNSRCEAVICLLSESWLTSHECKTEFRTAESLGKQILIARLADTGDTDITSEWQRCDLFGGTATTTIDVRNAPSVVFNTAGLTQLRDAIRGAGTGPENFVWPPRRDPERPPYRGWQPFEDIDAGVFFGRDAATVRGLDELRGMRNDGLKSLFVVLGPSGSGKSSFLRAGLVPRLQREDRHFLTLGVMRPQRAALTGTMGLAAAIDSARRTLKLGGTPLGDIKTACTRDPERVAALLVELRTVAAERLLTAKRDAIAPTLVLPLDQAEELFAAASKRGISMINLTRGIFEKNAVAGDIRHPGVATGKIVQGATGGHVLGSKGGMEIIIEIGAVGRTRRNFQFIRFWSFSICLMGARATLT